jgi:hypothetical protein
VFHWFGASLSFLDLSVIFAIIEASVPFVQVWSELLTEGRLKNGTLLHAVCHSNPSDAIPVNHH